MRDHIPSTGRSHKILPAILITANLLMFVIGILTIPPNLRPATGKESPVQQVVQKAPVTPSPKTETPLVTMDSGHNPAPKETSVSLSTRKRPNLGDFLWYTEGVAYEGVPSDATIINNIGPLTGSWKALIVHDLNNEYDASGMEFLNIVLTGTAKNLSVTLDWYESYLANEGKRLDKSNMEDSVFNGKWENSGLWASGAGTIHLTQFYEQNGKQYAVGTMDTPDGTPALVALVRP